MTLPGTLPRRAMLLAAGLGLRLRPITLELPKPLVAVAGRSMLDRALDRLDEVGCDRKIINLHWLGDKIRRHLAGRSDIAFSEEPLLLETGGGVAQALPLLGPDPFYVCNADIIWQDRGEASLARLAAAFDPARMDGLLLLHPVATAFGYDGQGDFHLAGDGRLARRQSGGWCRHLFAGVQILHPRLFDDCPAGAFSLNLLYDRAMAADRLFGMVQDGSWFHIGTPSALAQADPLIRAGES
jgi:MurNAc alpha-1-phosphate uridylyltransferase